MPTSPPHIQTWQQDLPHGITLSCRACGEPGRPVLMFLHGFPEAAWVWDPLLAHFSQPENGGYRCVAPNLRGYERSSAPDDVKAYRAKHLVQDIVALINLESGPAPLAALVAHDWGGAVAWSLANQHPERLRQLVIVNSPHPGPFLKALQSDPAQQAASDYMNFLRAPMPLRCWQPTTLNGCWGFWTGTTANCPHSRKPRVRSWRACPLAHPEVKARYRQTWRHGLQGGLNYYRASPLRPATAQDPGASAVQIPPEALHIGMPTLVLWAQDDIALLPCLTEGLAQHVPDLKLVPIAKASHWVVHEKPGRVIREITAFLTPPTQ